MRGGTFVSPPFSDAPQRLTVLRLKSSSITYTDTFDGNRRLSYPTLFTKSQSNSKSYTVPWY